ncbi:hypothetical protein G9A89_001097 [Geosiphon pyriformis]|nr:hypothetical protein G9A89_001097 [Geosiphon pyriformis]
MIKRIFRSNPFLDSETLKTQMFPYLLSFQNKADLAEYLQELLGITGDRTTFIEEFVTRRFPQKTTQAFLTTNQVPPKAIIHNTSHQPADRGRKERSRGQSPIPTKDEDPREEAWKKDGNIYFKKSAEENYFVGSKKSKQSKTLAQVVQENIPSTSSSSELSPLPLPKGSSQQRSNSPNSSIPSFPSLGPSAELNRSVSLPATTSKKKDAKLQPKKLVDIEKALKELEAQNIDNVDGDSQLKRIPCNCQATKHALLSIAPNCLNCGKIICVKEGVGPCTFCGTPVISREQQLDLVKQAKRLKNENQKAAGKKKKPGTGGTVPYAAKVSGNLLSTSSGSWAELGKTEDEERMRQIREEKRRAAELHKETLLEYDRTSAKRSTIIDQAADFALPADRPNHWLTEQERLALGKKQQSNMRKIETKPYQKRQVMTIDAVNRRVIVEEFDYEEEPNETPAKKFDENKIPAHSKPIGEEDHKPVPRRQLESVFTPKFVSVKPNKPKGRKVANPEQDESSSKSTMAQKTITRVQDIDEYFEGPFLSGGVEPMVRDEVEPDCG